MIEGSTDSEMLAALHARAFEKPWSADAIARLLDNPSAFALIWRDGDAVLGFVLAWAVAAESEILTLAVVPEARRKGIGGGLVSGAGAAALLRGSASMLLEVGETNSAARALYSKLGFEQVGRRGGYYAGAGGATDAIVMRRALPRPVI
ncbi:ribosomal-protein-S18p-alanine acetyltransferase [alpha proteobacterium U9-1i]|nr:ribosomal-protein-S18p-alanine acetyltransferase [alpha proteobacterium U9-1i]